MASLGGVQVGHTYKRSLAELAFMNAELDWEACKWAVARIAKHLNVDVESLASLDKT